MRACRGRGETFRSSLLDEQNVHGSVGEHDEGGGKDGETDDVAPQS